MLINIKKLTATIFTSALLVTGAANAVPFVEYNFDTATGTTHAATTTAAGVTASVLTLTNVSNTSAAFSNHFYHNSWSAGLDGSKYYETTISAASYALDMLTFSMENTGAGNSTYWMRSSLDGFVADLSSGIFSNGFVTDFSADLTALGNLAGATTFRWYVSAPSTGARAGFANHDCPGAGCGAQDVGADLVFNGTLTAVPEPGTMTLLALGLAGIGFTRRKTL